MYIDSYNKSFRTNYKVQCCNSGYQYYINENDGWTEQTRQGTISIALNRMYASPHQDSEHIFWWLSSPSSYAMVDICIVSGVNLNLNHGAYSATFGICPLISLDNAVHLKFQ